MIDMIMEKFALLQLGFWMIAWSLLFQPKGLTSVASSAWDKQMIESNNSTQQDWDADDAPDMSDPYWVARLDKAILHRGRPKLETPKVSTTIRFDADVLARFRAGGAGWQSRINAALRQWLSEHASDA
jgi:uncharacterized protein (DUF4415 family)